jgi:hypothetical protein
MLIETAASTPPHDGLRALIEQLKGYLAAVDIVTE